MPKSPIDVDEVLKQLASEAVRHSENVRDTVRDLTLRALQARGVSLAQIQQILKSVTEGVNLGAAKAKIDADKPLADALAGMDDALLKAVEASRITLQSLTDQGVDFKDSKIKKALDDLEKLEDQFLGTVRQAAEGASKQVRGHWAGVFERFQPGSTGTGAQVDAYLAAWNEQMRTAMREQRAASLKAAHLMTQNFATLASGVLIGLSEAYAQQRKAESKSKND